MTETFERAVKAITEAFEREGRVFDEGQAEMLVRATLEAIREPTDCMLDAGWEHTGDPCWKENVADAWRAMVNVALGQKT